MKRPPKNVSKRNIARYLMPSAIQLPRQPISLQKRLPHFLSQRLQAIERTNGGYVLRQLRFAAHVMEIAAGIQAESV